MNSIKYVHTNIVAKDWRKLSQFYIDVFDCKLLQPERDLSGEWIDTMTAIKDVRIRGVHLALPGYESGPTLEIFSFEPEVSRNQEPKINLHGFGHLAFHVDHVEEILNKLIAHGGERLGDVITKKYETLGTLTAVYAKDPEGNFVEIQNWKK
ncbi:MAG: VOC family protein [Clostridia bacterium]|nr:VOC family protein [Clostridia bacterium]